MKPMNALSMPIRHIRKSEHLEYLMDAIPSLAPLVTTTSVSGLISLPKNGEYAAATAFLRRGFPCAIVSKSKDTFTQKINRKRTLVGAYWLDSTLSRASFAASITNFGGL